VGVNDYLIVSPPPILPLPTKEMGMKRTFPD
jgi:hypothetical protein